MLIHEQKILLWRLNLVCAEARGCFRHVDDVMVTSLVRRPCVSSCIHPLRSLTRRRRCVGSDYWPSTSALISSVPACVRVESMLVMHVRALGGIDASRACVRATSCTRSPAPASIWLPGTGSTPAPPCWGARGGFRWCWRTAARCGRRSAETLTRRPTSYSRTHSAGDTGSLARGRRACLHQFASLTLTLTVALTPLVDVHNDVRAASNCGSTLHNHMPPARLDWSWRNLYSEEHHVQTCRYNVANVTCIAVAWCPSIRIVWFLLCFRHLHCFAAL